MRGAQRLLCGIKKRGWLELPTIQYRMPRPKVDHTGMVYGHLTVLGFAGRVKRPNQSGTNRRKIRYDCAWTCRCECGSVKDYLASKLVCGDIKSCGCHRIIPATAKAAEKNVYNQYKRNAERRQLAFELTEEFCSYLFRQPCFYCGSEPANI